MSLRRTERADGSHGGATRIRDMAALSLRPTLTEVSKVLTPCHAATPLRWELRHPGARVASSSWLGRSEFARHKTTLRRFCSLNVTRPEFAAPTAGLAHGRYTCCTLRPAP